MRGPFRVRIEAPMQTQLQPPSPAAPSSTPRPPRSRAALAADAAVFAVFVVLAKFTHHGDANWLRSAIETTLLYALGWACAALTFGIYRRPAELGRASLAVVFGISLGQVLRTVLRSRPLVPSFALASFAAFAGLLLGWRLVAVAARALRARR